MSSSGQPTKPVAFKNEAFLDSDDGRPLRILAEYLEPLHAFQRECVRDTIVFFGSARLAPDGPYYEAARELTVTPCLAAPCRLIRDTNLAQVSAGMAWHYEHPSASKPARIGSDTPRTKMRRARGVAGCGLIRPRCRHGIVGCVID